MRGNQRGLERACWFACWLQKLDVRGLETQPHLRPRRPCASDDHDGIDIPALPRVRLVYAIAGCVINSNFVHADLASNVAVLETRAQHSPTKLLLRGVNQLGRFTGSREADVDAVLRPVPSIYSRLPRDARVFQPQLHIRRACRERDVAVSR